MVPEVNLKYVLIAFLCFNLGVFFYSVRELIIMKFLKRLNVKLRDLFVLEFLAIAVNNLTPSARFGGGLVKSAVLKTKKVDFKKALTSIYFGKFFDMLTLIFLALFGILALNLDQNFFFIFSISLIIFLAVFLLISCRESIFSRFVAKFKKFKELGIEKHVADIEREFTENFTLKNVVLAYPLTIFVISMDILRIHFVFLALGYDIPLKKLAVIYPLSLLSGVFTITPGGTGIIEATYTLLVKYLGDIPTKQALLGVLIDRAIFSGYPVVLGLIVGTFYGVKLKVWKLIKMVRNEGKSIKEVFKKYLKYEEDFE